MTKAAPMTPVVRLQRTINASPERVFDAWLDAKALARFMRGSADIEACDAVNDPRVGGRFIITMVGKNLYPHTGEYLEITRPSRIVFTWHSKATQMQPSTVTIELRPAAGGATELTLTHVGLAEAVAQGHNSGWSSILDLLPGEFAS